MTEVELTSFACILGVQAKRETLIIKLDRKFEQGNDLPNVVISREEIQLSVGIVGENALKFAEVRLIPRDRNSFGSTRPVRHRTRETNILFVRSYM